ncbi:MAG: type I-U CRISPR-associated helicase/endonuclease Cas3 [Actinomycetaceae bacterium]|nr:type I-U CRISPR-associated helicase/endonuclease Cas3 [Actinomycetaceae bacterium]
MKATDFDRFMREVHGHPPFPWQSAVVEETLNRGIWPAMVDVPTGLGKTSMLDIAVFVLALGAGGETAPGLGRRRIYLVVDRRIVVDQTEEHARRIAKAVDEAVPGTICWEVAQRLRSLSGMDAPTSVLHVVKMRGGATWDAAWLPRPDVPAIITGTVDQVGSRLFFRGYGVSSRRYPIDAALVGTDSLIMIDEAHLSQAFTSSLASAQAVDHSEVLGLPKTSIIHLSATNVAPPEGWVPTFDEDAHTVNKIARQRLAAPKALTFVESTEKKIVADIASYVADALSAKTKQVPRVLVVCNTVNRAREVYQTLTDGKYKCADTEVLLLMGRSRALDRERTTSRIVELFGAGRDASPGAAVLVATQTVEVGIDLDASDMISETASWDALVQRMGRVNRRGEWAESTVIVVEDNVPAPPVYGKAKIATADFLRGLATYPIDVSPLALRHLSVPDGLTALPPLLPLLLPAHLDAWARTSPAPSTDPPVDPYLHGINRSLAPITLLWRDGLLDNLGEQLPAHEAGAIVDLLPIHSEETVDIPLGAVRAWLSGGKTPPIADVDDFDDIVFDNVDCPRELLRKAGDSEWRWVTVGALRPGDVVVAPSEFGGLDRFGWEPTSTEKVIDVAELAALQRGVAMLRLDGGLSARLGLLAPTSLQELIVNWRNSDDPDEREEISQRIVESVRDWLANSDATYEDSLWSAEDIENLANAMAGNVIVMGSDGSDHAILRSTFLDSGWKTVDEDRVADSSSLARRVTLAEHLDSVAARAELIANHLNLPKELRRAIVDAARWHDLGKVDTRFQAMLFGGSVIAAELAEEPLAKSGMPPGDRVQHRRAQQLSGLPKGARHEAWSETIVAEHLDNLPNPYPSDAELVRHLVASHHGYARPLLPPVKDQVGSTLEAHFGSIHVSVSHPYGVRLSDADRFARLNARYGRWGLALLETIVRCSDMTVSSEGS